VLLDLLAQAVEQVCTNTPGVGDRDRWLFETAVIEIGTNLVEHASPRGPGPVQVEAYIASTASELVATFHDDALPAEVDLHPPGPEDLASSGRGLLLVHKAVHRLEFEAAAAGNTWTLARRYSSTT
jgi:serine/threonine-protein kinase RsbW